MCAKIMIVDDSEDIREVVEVMLIDEGYDVVTADSGENALRMLHEHHNIDLFILDIMLPGKSGFECCKVIREVTTAPILFLSAKSHIEDKETGLALGADDYLPKPFSPVELIARVKALLRRYAVYQGKDQNPKSDILRIRGLRIHPTSGDVWLDNNPISLRYMEYKLLVLLASNRGRILSAKEIYETIWEETFLPVSNNTVVAHIKNLRQQIEKDPKDPKYVHTVWGRGYQIV